MTLLLDARLHPSLNPVWWRIPLWAVLTAFTVSQASGVGDRVAAGVLMGTSAAVLQLLSFVHGRAAQVSIVVCIVTGLAAVLFAPNGIAELPVVVATSRAPVHVDGRVLRGFTVLVTIAFAAVLAIALHSFSALLTGTAIPFFVQRAIDHQELIRERDRAQALLAEVQRGRESEAQAAALQERGRIAREMHDVLAHSLAGLSVQLQAIRAVAARENAGPAVVEPLDRAAALARNGLAEARAAVSTLRDPIGLGLDELPALIDRHPGRATLDADGEAAQVTPEAGHAVYRAVQESLTNAARYAPGSPIDIGVHWGADELVVTVRDGGPGPGREAVAGQGTGLGLAGMDERVREVGGRVESGPDPDGPGWRVEVHVPVGVGAAR